MSDKEKKPKPERSPLALPENLKATVAVCEKCSPRLFMGFGGFLKPPAHFDVKSGELHTARLVEVDANEKIQSDENHDSFGARMMKKYGA